MEISSFAATTGRQKRGIQNEIAEKGVPNQRHRISQGAASATTVVTTWVPTRPLARARGVRSLSQVHWTCHAHRAPQLTPRGWTPLAGDDTALWRLGRPYAAAMGSLVLTCVRTRRG
jgi:hypothetical protein